MVGMAEDEDMGVGQITTKKTMFGRVVYTFDGMEFETEEAARSDRAIIIERKRAEKAKREAKLEEKREEEERAREVEQIYRAYDESPEIITYWVQTLPNRDKKKVLGGLLGERDTNLAAFVDMEALSSGIYEICREISLKGYEVISVTPIEAGLGAYQFPGGKVVGGAGWGYSFTQGVIVTAKRRY